MSGEHAEPLDAGLIRQAMGSATWGRFAQFTVLQETDSTNSYLLRLPGKARHAHAILAEQQTGGRGRRQRSWHSPPGGNLYLSLGWNCSGCPWPLSTLPLVAGIAVSDALSRAGLQGHGIKWPNDILVRGKKLAGILVETESAGAGFATAVIGVGLNVKMPGTEDESLEKFIDRPWTDLASTLGSGGGDLNRNKLAALLLDKLMSALERFEVEGFPAFSKNWQDLDLLHGNGIRVEQGQKHIDGTARGVDADGALLLETGAPGLQAFYSGEVSVRYG